MKKIVTLLVALFVTGANTIAQEIIKPDYATIEKNVKDEKSGFYYTDLMERYTKADTTLTLQQMRHLYYGTAYTAPAVTAAEASVALEKMNALLTKPNPTEADFVLVADYSKTLLAHKPFSITVKQYRMFCLKKLGRYSEAVIERNQCDMIAEAIMSSGDGTSPEKSIHVIDTDNELEVVSLLGFEPVDGYKAVNGNHDFIMLNKNLYNRDGVYFYIDQPVREVTGL